MTGTLIKNYLDDKGIKYSFVATEIKMPLSTFSSALHEKRKVTAEEFIEICNVLNVSANYFQEQMNLAKNIGTAPC